MLPVYAQEVVGRNLAEIVPACLYFYDLEANQEWLRRRVETINFESELTLKKNLTLDIDFDRLTHLKEKYLQSSNCLYIPLQQGMRRTPILDVDVSLDGQNEVVLARRQENATIGAAVIVGSVLQSFYSNHPFPSSQNFAKELSWVPALLNDLTMSESTVDIYPGKELTFGRWRLPDEIPDEVGKCIRDSDDFGRYLLDYLAQYTLCALVRTTSSSASGIKRIKLSRQESISHDFSPSHDSGHGFLARSISRVFSGTEYMLPLSNFGMHINGGNHVRLQAPRGMSIDSVEIFRGNTPLPLERRGALDVTPKFWSVHYGYVSTTAASLASAADIETNRNSSFRIAIEMIYNRRKVELHDRGLSMYKSQHQAHGESISVGRMPWQVRLSMSSKRSRFLTPTLGLLVSTVYALLIAMIGMDKSGDSGKSLISSVSTLGLPLLLGFLVVGEEHLVLSRTLGLVRWIVGAATVAFVMTACTLAAGVSGIFAHALFAASMIIGILAIGLVCANIIRIQIFRTDSFEAFRYLVTRRFHELTDHRLAILGQGLVAYNEIELTRSARQLKPERVNNGLPSRRKTKSRLRRLKHQLFRVHCQGALTTLMDERVYDAWRRVISEAVSEIGIESAHTIDRISRFSCTLVRVVGKL